MALQSKLFFGDRSLQACSTQDTAHVAPNAIGDHVSKLHTALFVLDKVSVAASELRSQTYGRSTADAVLTYKRRRNIINRAYQNQADNIVGKLTIARMDAEMLLAERFSPPDSILNQPAST